MKIISIFLEMGKIELFNLYSLDEESIDTVMVDVNSWVRKSVKKFGFTPTLIFKIYEESNVKFDSLKSLEQYLKYELEEWNYARNLQRLQYFKRAEKIKTKRVLLWSVCDGFSIFDYVFSNVFVK